MAAIAFLAACKQERTKKDDYRWVSLEVTATAYNSLHSQTDGSPSIAAWGDTLKPGNKVIAVSRDLLDMGLDHNTMVRIEGLADTFYVKDKMHWRWKKRIDIYMDDNFGKAREWGKKKVCIEYALEKEESSLNSD